MKRKFILNSSSAILLLLFNILLTLWFTPYLIHHLGVEGYGLTAIAMQIATVFMLLSSSLVSSLSRFLTIDLRLNNFQSAYETFNSVFWFVLLLLIILASVIIPASYYVVEFLNIGDVNKQDAILLLILSFFSYLLYIARSVFLVSNFVQQRLYIQNFIQFVGTALRVLIVVIAFSLISTNLWYLGLGLLVGALFSLFQSILEWKKLKPSLKVSIYHFKYSRFKTICGMASWGALNNVGVVLLRNADLIIINSVLGVVAQGGYAAVLQLIIAMRMLVEAMVSGFVPIAVDHFAGGRPNRLHFLAKLLIKHLAILIAFPISYLIYYSEDILSVWLGDDFVHLANILRLLLITGFVMWIAIPLNSIQLAYNKVKTPALMSVFFGVCYIFLAIYLVDFDNNGFGVAIAFSVTMLSRILIFNFYYVAHIQSRKWWEYIVQIVFGFLGILIATLLCYLCDLMAGDVDATALKLIVSLLVCGCMYCVIAFIALFTRHEKKYFLGSVQRGYSKFHKNFKAI